MRPLGEPCRTTPTPDAMSDAQRRDGRYGEELRPLVVRSGAISRAQGSAYVECGRTKLFAAVYGPRSSTSRLLGKTVATLGSVTCEVTCAPFSSARTRRPHQAEAAGVDAAMLLLHALVPSIRRETFPNAFVDIYITVLEDDGALLATAITAASVALITGGVDMMDSVVGATLAVVDGRRASPSTERQESDALEDDDGSLPSHLSLLADPTADEEATSDALVTVAVLPGLNQIAQVHMHGAPLLTPAQAQEAMHGAIESARAAYDGVVRPALLSALAAAST